MLVEQLFFQRFQKQCCKHHSVYNSSKHNVANTIGFTSFPKHQLLTDVTVDMSKNKVAEMNGFSNIGFVNVVEPFTLTTLCSKILYNQWFKQLLEAGNDDGNDWN